MRLARGELANRGSSALRAGRHPTLVLPSFLTRVGRPRLARRSAARGDAKEAVFWGPYGPSLSLASLVVVWREAAAIMRRLSLATQRSLWTHLLTTTAALFPSMPRLSA